MIVSIRSAEDRRIYYNSTIRNDGFYIELVDQSSRIEFKHIHGLYRYVYNRIYDELFNLNVIDHYGRLRCPLDEMIAFLKKHFGLPEEDVYSPDIPWQIATLFHEIFVVHGGMQFAEWTRIYPMSFVTQAFLMCAKDLIYRPRMVLKKLKDKDDDIEISFGWLEQDHPSVTIHFDLEEQRYILVCRMINQFGNRVELVIQSNTDRIDGVLSDIDKTMDSLDTLVIYIGSDRRLHGTNKLLFTAKFRPKGEVSDDHFNAPEALREEDREACGIQGLLDCGCDG